MNTSIRLFTLSMLLCLTAATSAAAATYGGDAVGAEVTVSATGTTIRAATGTLSISGGMADAALSVGDIPGSATGGAASLAASALHSAIVGLGETTRAESSMGAIGLTVSGNQITSDFLMAQSAASCGPSVAGSSELVNLVINGQAITVTGEPNQTVSLPNGTVIINAQVPTVGGTSGQLVVTAIRVMTHDTITGQPIADAALAIADARIDCSGGSSASGAFITGGGWVPGNLGGKVTFGFVAGSQDGTTFRGHFTLKDHTGDTVHANVIANFNMCAGTFEASSTQNNDAVTVRVVDNGEPSTDDTIGVSGTYNLLEKMLSGGNIKNHNISCP
jgi:hypothetical protein